MGGELPTWEVHLLGNPRVLASLISSHKPHELLIYMPHMKNDHQACPQSVAFYY